MNIEEIKSLIGGGLRRDVPTVRQAWIEYGKLLLACPHKQGAKIGQWVREQELDFVPRSEDRADAKKLAELTLRTCAMLNLDDCPYSVPSHVLRWLRNQNKQAQPQKVPVEEKPEAQQQEVGGGEIRDALVQIRNGMGLLADIYVKTGRHYGLVDLEDTTTRVQGAGVVALLGGETYSQAVYRPAEGHETLPKGGVLRGYAKALRYRVVVEELDVAVWTDVPGISGMVTLIAQETIKEVVE